MNAIARSSEDRIETNNSAPQGRKAGRKERQTFFQQIPNNPVTNAMAQLNPADQQHLRKEVEQAMRQFEGPQGLVFPAELLLGVGTR